MNPAPTLGLLSQNKSNTSINFDSNNGIEFSSYSLPKQILIVILCIITAIGILANVGLSKAYPDLSCYPEVKLYWLCPFYGYLTILILLSFICCIFISIDFIKWLVKNTTNKRVT